MRPRRENQWILFEPARTHCLGSEGDRTHAQERKQPEQVIEDSSCHRFAAEQCHIASRPLAAVETSPSSGVITLASIAGLAIAKDVADPGQAWS